jgi:hypothetical protein
VTRVTASRTTSIRNIVEVRKMTEDSVRQIEAEIAELKARWPKHSVPPVMWQQLEDLEEELEKAGKATGMSDAQ